MRARGPLLRPALRLLLNRWRQWDWIAAQRVDRYVANSHLTASRVHRYLGREATVLHPPVEIERFRPGRVGEHYLALSELMPHKRIDVALRAFNALRPPAGRRRRRPGGPPACSASLARPSGSPAACPTRTSPSCCAPCRALVIPAAEEFGIAAVEALASGRPVLAAEGGGVSESVEAGVTGAFFRGGDARALTDCLRRFDTLAVDPAACVAAAQRFLPERFQAALRRIVDDAVEEERRPRVGERGAVMAGLVSLQGRRTNIRSVP